MWTDKGTEFSDAQLVTATAISEVIDLGSPPSLKSLSFQDLFLVIAVADRTGDGTMLISLTSSSSPTLSPPTTHWGTDVLTVGAAHLPAGKVKAVVPLPVTANYGRYLGVTYLVLTGDPAVTFNAYLTPTPPVGTIYPDAITG